MRSQTVTTAALLVFLFCCTLAAQPQTAWPQCSLASVVGQWAHSVSGWEIPQGATAPVQVTFMGVLNIDWSGKVTGPGTSIQGAPIPGTPIQAGQVLEYDYVNGSIQVTSECTGLLTTFIQLKGLPVPPLGPYVGRIIVLPDRGEMVALSIQSPSSKPMWTYTLKRITHVPGPVSWPQAPAPAASR